MCSSDLAIQPIADDHMRVKNLPLQRELLLNDDLDFRAIGFLRAQHGRKQQARQRNQRQPHAHAGVPGACTPPRSLSLHKPSLFAWRPALLRQTSGHIRRLHAPRKQHNRLRFYSIYRKFLRKFPVFSPTSMVNPRQTGQARKAIAFLTGRGTQQGRSASDAVFPARLDPADRTHWSARARCPARVRPALPVHGQPRGLTRASGDWQPDKAGRG